MKVWIMEAWDDEDDDVHQILVCKTKEIAEHIADSWKRHGWDNAYVKEMDVIENE